MCSNDSALHSLLFIIFYLNAFTKTDGLVENVQQCTVACSQTIAVVLSIYIITGISVGTRQPAFYTVIDSNNLDLHLSTAVSVAAVTAGRKPTEHIAAVHIGPAAA